jgi:hypothetical protein
VPPAIETLTVQTLATDAYCNRGITAFTDSVTASTTRTYLAYMTNSGSANCGSPPHPIRVLQYDYTTGEWTSVQVDSGVSPYCCDGHDAPFVQRDPLSGKIMVGFGGIDAGNSGNGPYYLMSSNADDITAWNTRSRVGTPGGFSEANGGYDASNVLHLAGQHQVNVPNGTDYARLNGGRWDSVRLVSCGSCSPSQGAPYSQFLAVRGSTLHLVWSNTTSGWWSGSDVYYARSTDGGETWCNAAGANCVSRTTGMVGTYNSGRSLYEWANYTVELNVSLSHNLRVDELPNGQMIIASRTTTGAFLYRWNGSSWTKTTIDTRAVNGYGLAMVVTSAGNVLVYGSDDANSCSPSGCSNMY